jgi:PAS domain S-box-containing protein
MSVITVAMLLLVSVTSVTLMIINNKQQEIVRQKYSKDLQHTVKHLIKHDIKDYTFLTQRIVKALDIVPYIKNRDREGLYRFLKPKWDIFVKENRYLTIMHVHLANGKSFLRMHMPKKYGDDLIKLRPMLENIHKNHKIISGYETGKYSTAYRIIVPIFDKEKNYIGAFELGINPNFFLDSIKDITGLRGMMFIRDKDLKLFKRESSVVIGNYRLQSVIRAQDRELFTKFISLNKLESGLEINLDNQKYMSHLSVLKDFNGNNKVKLILFQNITDDSLYIRSIFWVVIFIVGITLLLLSLLIYMKIVRYEFKVRKIYVSKKKYLQSIFDVTPNIIITVRDHEIDSVNPAMLKFFSYNSLGEFKEDHKCISEFFIEADECLEPYINSNKWLDHILKHSEDMHNISMMKDGEIHYFIVWAKAIKIDDKSRAVITFIDISDLKRLENSVNEAKEQFEQFMRYIPANIYIAEDKVIVYSNQSACDFFNRDTLVGCRAEDLLSPQRAQMLNMNFDVAMEKGSFEDVVEVQNYKGENRIFRTLLFKIDNGKNNKVGFASMDITQQYREHHDVKKFKEIIEKSPVSIIITDTDGNIEYVNRWFCDLTGYSADELIGENPRILKSDLHSEHEYKKLWYDITHNLVWSGVFKNIKKNGEEYWESAMIAPLRNEDKITNFIAIKQEITEKVYLQQELQDKEEIMIAQSRHAAMGEMIGMIAHQWRQPISVIAMGANNMLVDIELEELKEDAVKEQAESILKQTEYLSKTIDDFRNFFKPNKDVEEVNIQDVVEDAQKIIGKSLENNAITLKINSQSDIVVKTYSRELLQVYINILKNSKEALIEHTKENRFIDVSISLKGDYVSTIFCDNGGGIKDEYITKIFDPYFSTKDEKTGTGLGLYMSKTIVNKHLQGKIDVKNRDDGVCFTVDIPLELKNIQDKSE